MLRQMGINLAELYSKTTDFYLIVGSTYGFSMLVLSSTRICYRQSHQCTRHCRLRYIFQGLPNGIIGLEALSKILARAPCGLAP